MAPATSDKQQRFMGAELGRKRKGEETETSMSEKQLEDFATHKTKTKEMKYYGHGRKVHGS
jgi:hypothetical protein